MNVNVLKGSGCLLECGCNVMHVINNIFIMLIGKMHIGIYDPKYINNRTKVKLCKSFRLKIPSPIQKSTSSSFAVNSSSGSAALSDHFFLLFLQYPLSFL